MRIPFQALRAFVELVEARSFTKAAQSLFISQPAISKSIKELETLFGLKLIDRSYTPVQLTNHGEFLYKHGKSIFNIESAILRDFKLRSQAQLGNLSIGASTTIASHWLGSYLDVFLKDKPNINISVMSGNSQQIVNALRSCDIDLGLIEGPLSQEDDIELIEWRKEKLKLVASNINLTKEKTLDLSQIKWILREDGSGTARMTEEYLNNHHITPQSVVRVGSNLAVLDLVLRGVGVALLPEVVTDRHIKDGHLYEIKKINHPNYIQRQLSIIYLKWRAETILREQFIKLILK